MILQRGVQVLRTGDDRADRFQEQVRVLARDLAKIPFLFGQEITGVKLSATPTRVQHGLGRPWRGYAVQRRSANATVWDGGDGSNPKESLTLTASGNVTVDLWVW